MITKNLFSEFLGKFRGGVARPNRYRVEFFLPQGVALANGQLGVNTDATRGQITSMQNYFNSKEQVNVKCLTAQMPSRDIQTYEYRMNSAPFRLPFSSSYSPVNFSFYADAAYDTRDYFEVWQSAVVNLATNTMNFPDEYMSDITIMALDVRGEDTYGVKLFDAWPHVISETSLGAAEQNSASVVSVGIDYRYWQPLFNSQQANKSK